MRRVLCVLTAIGGLLWGASHAWAGGTVVNGPTKATVADCTAGSTPSFEGFGDETLIVLGCAEPAGSAPVVIAADNSDAYACFYVAPPGAENAGPCTQVRSAKPPFGGPLTAWKRSGSPVTGGDEIAALQIGAYPSGTYVSGQVPEGTTRVSIRSGSLRRAAAMLPVDQALGSRIGATRPFSVFVGRIPADVDTCAGVSVVARSATHRREARYGKGDQAWPSGPVPVGRSRACSVGGAWSVGGAARAVGVLLRKASRLRPSGV